jgi:hypothetical protein
MAICRKWPSQTLSHSGLMLETDSETEKAVMENVATDFAEFYS